MISIVKSNPYDRGPFRKREIPTMILGSAMIIGGVYELVQFFAGRAREAQAANTPPGSAPPGSAPRSNGRGSRWGA